MKTEDVDRQTIYVLQGPPAAGKTTRAKYIHAQDVEGTVIVSRDAIRESLGTYWVESREPYVRAIECQMVETALSFGYSVIIDNTGMDQTCLEKWKELSVRYDTDIIFIPILLSKDECKIRNKCKNRRPVPEEFIDEFFEKYKDFLNSK